MSHWFEKLSSVITVGALAKGISAGDDLPYTGGVGMHWAVSALQ